MKINKIWIILKIIGLHNTCCFTKISFLLYPFKFILKTANSTGGWRRKRWFKMWNHWIFGQVFWMKTMFSAWSCATGHNLVIRVRQVMFQNVRRKIVIPSWFCWSLLFFLFSCHWSFKAANRFFLEIKMFTNIFPEVRLKKNLRVVIFFCWDFNSSW